MKPNIAILGANSHIARGLIFNFLKKNNCSLNLYSTSPDKTRNFLQAINKDCKIFDGYSSFLKNKHDVLINCIGVGAAPKLKGNYSKYFTITETYDNLILEYLFKWTNALYVSLSSGVVYGTLYSSPTEEDSLNCIKVNKIKEEEYYAIARLNSETKHRSFKNYKIVDLRIFSYFSRYMDVEDGYFINELMECLLNKRTFFTSSNNIIRDYIHPEDLFCLIDKCIHTNKINAAYDAISAKPVDKMTIIEYFSSTYGLKYQFIHDLPDSSATGMKNIYCSSYNAASAIGYFPQYTSLEAIQLESKYLIKDDRQKKL